MRSIGTATLVVFAIAALPAHGLWAATSRGTIIAQSTALKQGLVRAWYAHVEIDGARDRVIHAAVDRDSIFFQSELGLVENIESATGRQLWIREIGRRIDPVLPLGATDAWVAVIGGPRLYLLNRASGHVEFVRRFDGMASAGPSVSALRVYVPLMQGPLESFQLPTVDDAVKTAVGQLPPRTFPWKHFSSGRTVGGLLITSQAVAWTTDRGNLYISELDSRQPLYRVETGDDIVVPLAYREPLIYGVSLGGFVYAVDETTGDVAWRVSLGSPVRAAPAIVGDRLYVCPDRRGMVCLDASQGGELWWAPRATRFVAASPTRIYAMDASHRLLILDAQNGTRLGVLPTQNLSLVVSNVATDRIFLGTPSGSIQCLHEIELTEPVRHWKKAAEKQPDSADKEPESGEVTPDAGDEPNAEDAEPDQRDPFGGEGQDPFGGDNRDPFGEE